MYLFAVPLKFTGQENNYTFYPSIRLSFSKNSKQFILWKQKIHQRTKSVSVHDSCARQASFGH